jgi:hypothetical protein
MEAIDLESLNALEGRGLSLPRGLLYDSIHANEKAKEQCDTAGQKASEHGNSFPSCAGKAELQLSGSRYPDRRVSAAV